MIEDFRMNIQFTIFNFQFPASDGNGSGRSGSADRMDLHPAGARILLTGKMKIIKD